MTINPEGILLAAIKAALREDPPPPGQVSAITIDAQVIDGFPKFLQSLGLERAIELVASATLPHARVEIEKIRLIGGREEDEL